MSKHVSKHKSRLFRRIRHFTQSTKAVSALEYAILVAVIAVGVGAALLQFGDTIETSIADMGTAASTSATQAATGTPA